jgi:hypothetical protein
MGLTWADFCDKRLGVSRSFADGLIQRLDTLGEAYFRLAEYARISPATYKQISGRLTENTIELGGEQIPLTPENAPKIRAGIRELRAELRREQQRKCPNIAELQVMSDNVLKFAHELSAPHWGTTVREHLAEFAAANGKRWTSLSKSLRESLRQGR